MARYGRAQPHQPVLPRLVYPSYSPAAVAPFTSTSIQAQQRNPVSSKQRRFHNQVGPWLNNIQPPAVPTTWFKGLSIHAKRKGVTPRQRAAVILPTGQVGPATPMVPVPNYTGYRVARVARFQRPSGRAHKTLTRFRFTPVAGFAGAKNGFLTVMPTRSLGNFTIQPTRSATFGVL
jgi:hypothetical protein